jgi:hypothetical protein
MSIDGLTKCIAGLPTSREWEPAVESRLQQAEHRAYRRRQRRRATAWSVLGFAAVCLLILSFPSSRAWAQLLFQRVVLKGIQIAGIRPDLTTTSEPHRAVAEAEEEAAVAAVAEPRSHRVQVQCGRP